MGTLLSLNITGCVVMSEENKYKLIIGPYSGKTAVSLFIL